MKPKSVFLSLTVYQLVAFTAALLRQSAITNDAELDKAVSRHLRLLPPLFKTKYVRNCDKEGSPLQVKCPVTKLVMRNKGDENESVSFLNSPACLAEWDDTDLDCATMRNDALEQAWEEYMDNHTHRDDYIEMVSCFIVMNYKLFAGRKLLLLVTEEEVCCHCTTTYSLLDASPGGVEPMTVLCSSENQLLVASNNFQRRLSHYYSSGKKLEPLYVSQLILQKDEIDRCIKGVKKNSEKADKN